MENLEIISGQVLRLPLDRVMPDPNNPRKDFDEDALQDLADDIKLRGVEQPITVYPLPAGFFRIKLGERRFRASKLAGMETIPALVAADSPDEAPELERLLDQVKENCLRKDLTPIEWGYFFKRLREDFNLQVKDIPDMLEQRGMKRISRSYISNFMRLTELPEWASAMIASGKIPGSWGKRLLVACESPKVEASVREALERDDDDYDSVRNETDLQAEIVNAYQEHHPRLDRRCTEWDQMQPLYKAAELKEEDREALRVRSIGGTDFVLDLEEHERRQQTARNAGATPARSSYPDDDEGEEGDGAGDAQNDRAPSREPEKKEVLPSTLNVCNYLTEWLRLHIISTVFDQKRGGKPAAEDLARRLVSWSAFHLPTPNRYSGSTGSDLGPASLLRANAQELGLGGLGDFLTENVDPSHKYERAARALIARMEEGNLMLVAAWLGIDFPAIYEIDEAYLELHTRAGLEKLAKGCSVLLSTLPTKVGDIRTAYLKIAGQFGTPPQLAKEWKRRFKENRELAKFAASLAGETGSPTTDAGDTKPKGKRKAKKQTEASADAT
jgi:ParB/RepB/Spo0J family partition protein